MKAVKTTFIFWFFFFALYFPLNKYLVSFYRATKPSMAPTVEEGDFVLGLRTSNFVKQVAQFFDSRTLGKIERGEVVVYFDSTSKQIGRVMALEGDRIDVSKKGVIKVNGVEINDSQLDNEFCQIEQNYGSTYKVCQSPELVFRSMQSVVEAGYIAISFDYRDANWSLLYVPKESVEATIIAELKYSAISSKF